MQKSYAVELIFNYVRATNRLLISSIQPLSEP